MDNNTCIRIFADINQINSCKEKINKVQNTLNKLSNALNLAGNDVRLKILFMLYEEQQLCVCDLSDILKMKIPAISQHLRKLKDGGIISNQKAGQRIFYFLNPEYEKLFKSFFKIIATNKKFIEIT